jgi:DNA-binding GntR family transcriptional regulator
MHNQLHHTLPKSARAAGEIADAIEDEIIFGTLRPHQEIAEDPLMSRFGAKRHVVRKAIADLVARQIVVKPPNRSARVRDFEVQQVQEIYAMRALLQKEAAMLLDFPDPSRIAEIEELCRAHERASQNGDLREIHRRNDHFHAALFDLCPNKTLVSEVARYNQMTNAIRSLGIADPELRARAIREHGAMVDALRDQNRDALATLVVQHIHPTCEKWLKMRKALAPAARTE